MFKIPQVALFARFTAFVEQTTTSGPGPRILVGVEPNSPARKAGVREGDVIVALDEKPVAGVDGLHRSLTDAQLGVRCELTIIRYTERVALSIYPEDAR